MTRPRTGFVLVVATLLCIAPLTRESFGQGKAQKPTLDGVLAAYVGGDYDIVQRTFLGSRAIQDFLRLDKPREFERWLGGWNRGKALLLLEFARTSARVAPQFVAVLVDHGRRYIASVRNPEMTSDHADFIRLWHRAAAGLLQGSSDPSRVEELVTAVPKDGRLMLARAVAQERRCWSDRPSLDQPAIRIEGLLETADARVQDDSVGTSKSEREATAARHRVCLREAQTRFEAAIASEDVAAEARVRGGWILFQNGLLTEALEWLDAAKPHNDPDLEYWHGLFRGRVLDAMGRYQDSASSYRAALALYPRAQSAGLGLAIALMHVDQMKEADDVSRSVREGGATTKDAWEIYPFGDQRFASRWIDSLRSAVR